MTHVDYHPEARRELAAAAFYLDERREGAGSTFVLHLQNKVQGLAEMPLMYAKVEGFDVRECLLGRYPYSVIYTFEDNAVLIVAVAHAKRERGYWKDRLTAPEDPT